ncbi:MAG: hypothetical protein IPK62_16070 [Bacteroidetes bacterium]|nr:hypothetical protein [Bacteroidota bacterium]
MRFDSQFEVKFTFSEGLVVDKIQIPTMILQPYVENAIWHGLLHKKGEGFIHISFEQMDKNLLKVCVTDNGVGRAKAKELGSKSALKSKSFGMQITHDRLGLLGQTGSKVAIVDLMDDNENHCGTRIEIMLPVIEKEV